MRTRRLAGNAIVQLALIVAALLAVFPLFWVLLTSFKTNKDAAAPAERAFTFTPTLANYAELFASPVFARAAVTSTVITLAATLIVVIVATLGGYAFARLRVPGRRTLASVMVLVQVIPGVVLIVPLFRMVSSIGAYDNWWPIALILAGLSIPFGTWLMLAFFRGSPIEIEEAAVVDGANRFKLFRYVLIPMVAPGIATVAIFTAIAVWNAFLIPLVLGQTRAQTLTVFAAQFITFQGVNWGPLCAGAVLILAPIVLFVLAMQRPLVKGLTAGSLK
ncbi:carbohydrate ABC transporter permease [Microbacterium sp. SSM24]|uniref:carbohydrate ABC transporter permease n=1 Tax=Microbacterium sp. SSM24 TaxID=2991714 RepID=UPI00222608AF|nr:carbohydrate ABC transporter permease [Microbacterium sp. SSM24]MCW3492565.1 carbohydrate ABC transporter permease [Microbacterium sp. SSM24]